MSSNTHKAANRSILLIHVNSVVLLGPAEFVLSKGMLYEISNMFQHQIQPWVPMMHHDLLHELFQEPTDEPIVNSGMAKQAVIAAVAPFFHELSLSSEEYFDCVWQSVSQKLLGESGLECLQAAVVLQFLVLGKGCIAKHWGLVATLPQFAIRAGLHLEDQKLSAEHRDYRRLMHFNETDQSWKGKESTRRLFWILFVHDNFAAALSGGRPSFESATIQRLLPCDGQRWTNNQPVETRSFVPAALMVEAHVSPTANIGGVAYLVEATEILSMISGFTTSIANKTAEGHDTRDLFQNFLNLDFILAGWTSRLPPRYQHASHDVNGYMDHNMTLGHITNNTSGILLYQSARTLYGLDVGTQFPPLGQVTAVKQAAKEIANISTKFLLHRRYIVSPQFCFCQFVAARALLAYSAWVLEDLDDDFGTLVSSLAEAAKRWHGIDSSHENGRQVSSESFPTKLVARLKIDMEQPEAIDLATPCLSLLAALNEQTPLTANTTSSQHHTDGNDQRGSQMSEVSMPSDEAQHPDGADLGLQGSPLDFFNGVDATGSTLSFLGSASFEDVADLACSWKDSDESGQLVQFGRATA
jgi:hypothetical protein